MTTRTDQLTLQFTGAHGDASPVTYTIRDRRPNDRTTSLDGMSLVDEAAARALAVEFLRRLDAIERN